MPGRRRQNDQRDRRRNRLERKNRRHLSRAHCQETGFEFQCGVDSLRFETSLGGLANAVQSFALRPSVGKCPYKSLRSILTWIRVFPWLTERPEAWSIPSHGNDRFWSRINA